MRITHILVAGTALTASAAATAADQLSFGKAPAWVMPQTIPPVSAKSQDRPVALLLYDQQTLLEPGKISTYSELAFKIQKPEGLDAGNLSIAWNPAFDTMTVNRLEIHRGGHVIDVLKSGQTFTTMRRESNLELAMLDGMLTANIQPENLQEGDVVVLATTTEHADPVLKGHVETNFALWGEAQVGLAHARLSWPLNVELRLHKAGDLSTAQQSARDGRNIYELTMRDIDPVIDPKGAPLRFKIGRMGEATDFRSWADAARLMIPLYREAAVIPASGPLRDEVEKIRKTSADPKVRAEHALQLVQQRIRYVALAMGQGGLVPAPAETTWSRRFGDCKAKTALLLAILHEYGIIAEPVLVNAFAGDAVAEGLPMIGAFNHVLVRAHVDSKTYYLDGTRTGDTDLDGIDMPDFGWVLPVLDNAQLVHLVPPPLNRPQSDTTVAIDASAGIYTPADINVAQVIRGDLAVAFNLGLASLTETQRKQFFDNYWKKTVEDITPGDNAFAFDKAARELRLSMRGKLKLDWSGGFFHLPLSSIGYTPDLDRPEGPLHDAPFAVAHPMFARTETKLRMPAAFFPSNVTSLVPGPVHQTLIGIEYSRVQSATPDGMVVQTTTRSLVPEVSYKEAVAAASTLKAVAYGDVSVRLPASYHATAADLVALKADLGGSAADLVTRGNTLNESGQFQDAVAMFDKAFELDSKGVTALADRAISYTWLRKFDLAKKDVDAALAIDPTNAIALRARGLGAELTRDWDRAIEAYTASLGAEPQNGFAIGHRAICEAALSRNDEALADSALALKSNHAWIDLRVLRANILLRQGRNDDVATEARLVASENPQSTYALVAAGRIYARIKRNAEAMKAFDAALAIKPEAFIYLNRAQSRPFTDKSARLADLSAALKLEPNDPDALAEKAEQLGVAGDFKGAIELYEKVVKAAPGTKYLMLRRATWLFKAGRRSEAQKLFAEQREQAKTSTDFNSLCWNNATASILLEAALQDCQQAIHLDPDSGAIIDSLAFVQLRLGKLDEAIILYDKAIAKKMGSATYMGRAIAYARKGDQTRAAADRVQALRLDPDAVTRFAEYGLNFDKISAAAAK
jgi:tetratricopeptide (TPR) repeat protein